MIKNSLSFVLLIIITNFGIAVSDDFTGHLYYSGEYSKLPGYISTSGLDSKSEEITEASSAAGVKMDWGPKWYQGFEIDVYSKANLFPVKMGTGPDTDIDMFYLAAAFGVPLSPQLSRMIYTITKYQAIGIVDGDVPLSKLMALS